MQRAVWIVLALAACGTKPRPPAQHSQDAVATPLAPSTPPDAAPPVVPPAPGFTAVSAPHTAGITMLAATGDGAAALSVDQTSSYRLWPTLDAKHEPVVVDLPPPRGIALVRGGDDFVAAVLDDAGVVIVAHVDRDGRVTKHAEVRAAPFAGVVAANDRFIGWTEKAVVTIDANGEVTSTQPIEKVVAVAAGGDRLVAATPTTTRVIAGEPIKGADRLTAIAISPDGERLAGIGSKGAILIEIASGRVLATRSVKHATRIGFVDDEHVAIAGTGGALTWFGADPSPPLATPAIAKSTSEGVLAVGGGKALIARDAGDVVIATPGQPLQYLGYRIAGYSATSRGRDGTLLVGSDSAWALLDRKLDVVATPKLWIPPKHERRGVTWMGGDDWLVTATTANATSICLDDAARGTGRVVRTSTNRGDVSYDRESKLVVMSDGGLAAELARYDGAKRALDKLAWPAERGQGDLVPVAPKRANGAQLVRFAWDQTTSTGELEWIRDLGDRNVAGMPVKDSWGAMAYDTAGHVFVFTDPQTNPRVHAYRDGRHLWDVDVKYVRALVPDPSGTRVAIATNDGTELYNSADGAQLWSMTHDLVNSAPIWLDDNTLVLDDRSALVPVDLSLGALGTPRCGWQLQLSTTPSDSGRGTMGVSTCRALATGRGDPIESTGHAEWKRLVRTLAGNHGAKIADWGTFQIGGKRRRSAILVGGEITSYLFEVAPGKTVAIVIKGWGFSELTADVLPDTEPPWTIGPGLIADKWGNPLRSRDDDGIHYSSRWIHGSNESISITLRGETPIVTNHSWFEVGDRNEKTGIRDTTSGGTHTPTPVKSFKPYSAKIAVRGPGNKPEDIDLGPDPKWEP